MKRYPLISWASIMLETLMIRRLSLVAVVLLLGITCFAIPAQAATEVGAVTRVKGACFGESEGSRRELEIGHAVYLAEEITTGAAARLRITFDDGSVLTIGEQARVVIDTFVYDPVDGLDRFLMTTTGPFRLATGVLKTPNATIEVETPAAMMGVRGTDFWAGPIDGRFGVLVLEGSVSVSNSVDETLLDEPGVGVNIDGADAPFSAVTQWPQDKVDRALEAVAF